MSNLDWAAGFFEGEGTVRINKGRISSPWAFGLQVGNSDIEVLKKFQEAVFGFGTIYGPYRPYGNLTKKEYYVWSCNRRIEVQKIKDVLYPLLSKRRKKQIDDAIETICAHRLACA